MKTLLALAALAIVPAFAAETAPAAGAAPACCAAEQECPVITVADLKAAIDAKTVTVIDCNGTETYAAGHVPGAIDFQANGAKLASLLPTSKTALIVSYCGGPQCGAYKRGCEAVVALGYTNVKHLKAGISGWKEAKQPVEAAAAATAH